MDNTDELMGIWKFYIKDNPNTIPAWAKHPKSFLSWAKTKFKSGDQIYLKTENDMYLPYNIQFKPPQIEENIQFNIIDEDPIEINIQTKEISFTDPNEEPEIIINNLDNLIFKQLSQPDKNLDDTEDEIIINRPQPKIEYTHIPDNKEIQDIDPSEKTKKRGRPKKGE